MRGTQTGPFTVFPPGGKPVAFPPTGREFAVRHGHVIRFRDGLSAEHIAVRDDLGFRRHRAAGVMTPEWGS